MAEDNKPHRPPGIDNIIAYAGTPNGIPGAELEENWGPLNKQLAFSNLSPNDILDIEDILRNRELQAQASKRDHELRAMDLKGSGQIRIITKCLSSLGRDGFLIKRATTASHEITNKNVSDDKKRRFLGIGSPKPQQPQQTVSQQQGV